MGNSDSLGERDALACELPRIGLAQDYASEVALVDDGLLFHVLQIAVDVEHAHIYNERTDDNIVSDYCSAARELLHNHPRLLEGAGVWRVGFSDCLRDSVFSEDPRNALYGLICRLINILEPTGVRIEVFRGSA